ncbi:MAG TPA: hypothetical protein IAB04_04240 [Candidatus Avimonoglobus intestinipullorum]|uniref:Uncharacterized protein n=1 Tax=Candidatus Avimonoglobus intestinipullorum TaxID=2840699 RepID=A0A9D1S6S0_9FIRM|nr:hypothetical protein [Candidatus Avimonoglobus intestinipullorum]
MKKYIPPKIEIKLFEVADVIAASGAAGLDYENDPNVEWTGTVDFSELQ